MKKSLFRFRLKWKISKAKKWRIRKMIKLSRRSKNNLNLEKSEEWVNFVEMFVLLQLL